MEDLRIEDGGTGVGFEHIAALRAVVKPEPGTTSADAVAHLHTIVGVPRFRVAFGDGAIAYSLAGVLPGREGADALWFDIGVLPGWRRRGIGSGLLADVSSHAAELGKTELVCTAREDDGAASAFLLNRGFREYERRRKLSLDLAAAPQPGRPPDDIAIVTYAERPDLAREMYEVFCEGVADIPGDEAEARLTFEQWHAQEIADPTRHPDRIFAAVEGDRVVGFAALEAVSDAEWRNGYLAVARSHRRRGVGRALKLAQIEFARRAGVQRLVTGSTERNEPMHRLNVALGYRFVPGLVSYRGPLANDLARTG